MEIKEVLYGVYPKVVDISQYRNDFIKFTLTGLQISDKIDFNKIIKDPLPYVKKIVYLNILLDDKIYKYEIIEENNTIINEFTIDVLNMENIFLKTIILDNSKITDKKNPTNYWAILAQFKNEAHILKEWIDHYLWQGVSKLFLINNDSNDNYAEILKPYITNGIVELFHMPEKHKQNINYNYIYNKDIKNKYQWLSVIDLDEFIFAPKNNLISILNEFDSHKKINQLLVEWAMFGSSGFIEQPPSVRSSFIHRSPEKQLTKYFIKCGPEYSSSIDMIWIHSVYTNSGYRILLDDENIRLYHYPIQSLNFFTNIKMTRGDVSSVTNDKVRDLQYFKKYDYKDVIDETLKNLIIELI